MTALVPATNLIAYLEDVGAAPQLGVAWVVASMTWVFDAKAEPSKFRYIIEREKIMTNMY